MKVKLNTQAFRVLRADEVDPGFALYQRVRDWLREQEIRLWLAALPKQRFEERQARGELFGLFVDNELAVIMAVVREMPAYWQTEIGTESEWWLATIATEPRMHGRQLGRRAIAAAIEMLAGRGVGTVFLDCATGFLPGYYVGSGFSVIVEKEVTFPSGNTYPLALMKRDCVETDSFPPLTR